MQVICNPCILFEFLGLKVHRLISSLLLCILDATLIEGTSARCDYELRNVAAQVLAKVTWQEMYA
jgi:hypothetical protein